VQRELVDDYWKHLSKQEKLRRDKGVYSKAKEGRVKGPTLTNREQEQMLELETMNYTVKPDPNLGLALEPIRTKVHWAKDVYDMGDGEVFTKGVGTQQKSGGGGGGGGIPHTFDRGQYEYMHEMDARRQRSSERNDDHTRFEGREGREAYKNWDRLEEPMLDEIERRAIESLQGEEFISQQDRSRVAEDNSAARRTRFDDDVDEVDDGSDLQLAAEVPLSDIPDGDRTHWNKKKEARGYDSDVSVESADSAWSL
jgi:hypothetical protein